MKAWMSSLAIVIVAGLATNALAQCHHGKATADKGDQKTCTVKKSCTEGANVACQGGEASCHGKSAMATGMPLMTYQVGDETTQCPKQFAEWTEKHSNAKVKYTLNGESYCCKTTAMKAYAAALDNYLNSITHVSYAVGDQEMNCPVSAKAMASKNHEQVTYRLASHNFTDHDRAEKMAEIAREAAEKVHMTMMVDGKAVCCSADASCDPAKCAAKGCDPADCAKKGCDPSQCSGAAKVADKGTSCDPSKCDKAKAVADKGKSGCCADKATKVADKGDAKTCDPSKCGEATKVAGKRSYKVGNFETCCEQTAQLQLVKARIIAAHNAIANAMQDTESQGMAAKTTTGA
jgi:hypothetical protein